MCELWAVERRVVVDGRGGEHSNSQETGTGKPCEYIPSSVSARVRPEWQRAQILWPHQRSFHPVWPKLMLQCPSDNVILLTHAYFYRVWIWVGRYDKGGSAFVLPSISAAAVSTLSSSQFATSSYFGFWSIIPDPGPGRCQLRCR